MVFNQQVDYPNNGGLSCSIWGKNSRVHAYILFKSRDFSSIIDYQLRLALSSAYFMSCVKKWRTFFHWEERYSCESKQVQSHEKWNKINEQMCKKFKIEKISSVTTIWMNSIAS